MDWTEFIAGALMAFGVAFFVYGVIAWVRESRETRRKLRMVRETQKHW